MVNPTVIQQRQIQVLLVWISIISVVLFRKKNVKCITFADLMKTHGHVNTCWGRPPRVLGKGSNVGPSVTLPSSPGSATILLHVLGLTGHHLPRS